jgi:uncharacterized protein
MPSLSEVLSPYAAVIVTGGSSGIGKSFIELVASLCPTTPVCNLSRSIPVINLSQLKLRHVPCDLTDRAALVGAETAILKFLNEDAPSGRILLVNNSGFGAYGHFPEPGLAHHREMIDLNIVAVVDLTARLLPVLKARGGAIITVASTAAFQPTAYMATYGATKAFVLHWSLALGEELRGSGVHTLALCPGPTTTEFFRRAGLQKGSVADSLGQTSEAVVCEAVHALGAGRALVVTGWKNKLLVAGAGLMPKTWITRIAARVLARFRLKKVGT